MTQYVAGGWAAATVITVVYCWRTVRRGKVLARGFPKERRPWQ